MTLTAQELAAIRTGTGQCRHCSQPAITVRHNCRAVAHLHTEHRRRQEERQAACSHHHEVTRRADDGYDVYCRDCGIRLGELAELADMRNPW